MSFDKQVSETCKACFFHICLLCHIRASLTTEASWTKAAATVGSRLDFCNSLLAGTSFQIWLVFSLSRILLLGWSHKNLSCATSHLFSLICISFRFATELVLKLLQLLLGCYNFSSHPNDPILHLSSRDMYPRKHSALLHLCQYVLPHVKPPWQPPNHFHLLFQISGMHCQIICRPSQLLRLLEELSNIIYSCLLTLTVVQNLVRSIKCDFLYQMSNIEYPYVNNDWLWVYLGRGDGLEVKPMSRNPEGRGSIPRLGSRRSSLISIEHAELLRSTPSLVLCCAWLVTMARRLGPTQPVTDFWGWQIF